MTEYIRETVEDPVSSYFGNIVKMKKNERCTSFIKSIRGS